MTIAITRTGLDAAGFRRAAAREKDAAASRRMLALALVLEGRTRTEAAQAAGMDRQTLRDWVHRYNEAGLAGLTNRAGAGGRRRKLTAAQEATFAAWVREGPNRMCMRIPGLSDRAFRSDPIILSDLIRSWIPGHPIASDCSGRCC